MAEFTIEEGEVIEDPTGTGGGAIALSQLTDVDTTGVIDGQVLTYDAESQKWKPGTDNTGGEGGSGGDADTLQGQDGNYYRDRANHTGTQAAGTILQDSTHRMVSDTQVNTWNDKVDAAYVAAAINALIDGAPGALDTLKEISDQLASDESAVAALTSTVTGKEASTNKATDFTTVNNVKFPTVQAVATYLAAQLAGLTKSSVGLANVDNTSDAGKPISTATAAALALKANVSSLATVATSGAYADLSGRPVFAALTSLPGDLSGYPDGSRIVTTA